jgi:hypothetical protein
LDDITGEDVKETVSKLEKMADGDAADYAETVRKLRQWLMEMRRIMRRR